MSWAHPSPEQAEQIPQTLAQATEGDLRDIATLLASRPDHKLFWQNESDIRERVHMIGAKAIETAVDLRKNGGIEDPARVAPGAPEPLDSSANADVP